MTAIYWPVFPTFVYPLPFEGDKSYGHNTSTWQTDSHVATANASGDKKTNAILKKYIQIEADLLIASNPRSEGRRSSLGRVSLRSAA